MAKQPTDWVNVSLETGARALHDIPAPWHNIRICPIYERPTSRRRLEWTRTKGAPGLCPHPAEIITFSPYMQRRPARPSCCQPQTNNHAKTDPHQPELPQSPISIISPRLISGEGQLGSPRTPRHLCEGTPNFSAAWGWPRRGVGKKCSRAAHADPYMSSLSCCSRLTTPSALFDFCNELCRSTLLFSSLSY